MNVETLKRASELKRNIDQYKKHLSDIEGGALYCIGVTTKNGIQYLNLDFINNDLIIADYKKAVEYRINVSQNEFDAL